ncbi:MAG: hypothetical protein JSU93_03825 [Methanobacteriota archaeon]|nr:MAG: hypothetical protein JSU93_03825 [Euryarchaeota archaeon]
MIPGSRALGAMFAVFLAALLWLSAQAGAPMLCVSDLRGVEDGTIIRTSGIVAELREYETGSTSILLADHSSGDTVRVLLLTPLASTSASDVSIGDEILVRGVISVEAARPVVFAEEGGVSILSKARYSLSVELICTHWRLFEYDRFNVSGIVAIEQDPESAWLTDPLSGHRIRLSSQPLPEIVAAGSRVIVDCTLLMDMRTMSFHLNVWDMTLVPT